MTCKTGTTSNTFYSQPTQMIPATVSTFRRRSPGSACRRSSTYRLSCDMRVMLHIEGKRRLVCICPSTVTCICEDFLYSYIISPFYITHDMCNEHTHGRSLPLCLTWSCNETVGVSYVYASVACTLVHIHDEWLGRRKYMLLTRTQAMQSDTMMEVSKDSAV